MNEEKTSSRKINSAIRAVRTSAAKYNNLVQTAIVMIVEHANNYGDCTGAARLIEAMPRSNRRSLVISHFRDYSPINVSKDKEGAYRANLDKGNAERQPRAFDLDGVRANNWWERPEAQSLPEDVPTFNSIREAISKALASAETKAEKIANDDDKAAVTGFITALRNAAIDYSVATSEAATHGVTAKAASTNVAAIKATGGKAKKAA